MDIKTEAQKREQSFLNNLAAAQEDFEWIIDHSAWLTLGYDSFAEWWRIRIVPVMKALQMKPTRDIVEMGVHQVQKDDLLLPKSQRHFQREIGEMFDTPRQTITDMISRSLPGRIRP